MSDNAWVANPAEAYATIRPWVLEYTTTSIMVTALQSDALRLMRGSCPYREVYSKSNLGEIHHTLSNAILGEPLNLLSYTCSAKTEPGMWSHDQLLIASEFLTFF